MVWQYPKFAQNVKTSLNRNKKYQRLSLHKKKGTPIKADKGEDIAQHTMNKYQLVYIAKWVKT